MVPALNATVVTDMGSSKSPTFISSNIRTVSTPQVELLDTAEGSALETLRNQRYADDLAGLE